jgi:peptidoglycan/LPS O-acetylase OafA/YrhL
LALLLTAALDSLGMHLGYLVYSGNTAYPMINLILSANHGFTVALGNLAFLMTVYVPVFGTNGPLWSLMFEWWFYVIYALIWRLIARSLGWSTLLIIVLSVASHWPRIWPFELPRIVFSMMDVWWMGLLLAEAYAGRIRVRMAYLAFLTVLFVPALAYDQAVYNWSRLCWGGGFCGLIACGFALQNSGHALWPLNRLRELGRMSYTLYVCHMPMLALMSGALMAASPDKSLPRGFGPLFLGVMIILAACWLAHFVVEQPFLRRR